MGSADTDSVPFLFGYAGQARKWESELTDDGVAALKLLRRDLRLTNGTLAKRNWRSFGKLHQFKGRKKPFHCHLNNSEVAVWYIEKSKTEIQCIFIYIGARKDAPY
jgi:hypothetical protein